MSELQLRNYQTEAIDSFLQEVEVTEESGATFNRSWLITLITGLGKTVVMAGVVKGLLDRHPQARILTLAPSADVVTQNYLTFLQWTGNRDCGIVCSSLGKKNYNKQITHATVGSAYRQPLKMGKIDLLLIDEAHLVGDDSNGMYLKTIQGLRAINPQLILLGMTATPFRTDGSRIKLLTEIGTFNKVLYDGTSARFFNQCVREGYLAKIVPPDESILSIDVTGVRKGKNDYDEAQLTKAVRDGLEDRLEQAISIVKERKRIMYFCVSVLHAEIVHSELTARGLTSYLIHGNTDSKERQDSIQTFKSHEDDTGQMFIVSVGCLTTGFDCKTVDALVCDRPTQSLVLWLQMVGRLLRPHESKLDGLLLDFGGNLERHGAINSPSALLQDERDSLWICSDNNPLKFSTYAFTPEDEVESSGSQIMPDSLIFPDGVEESMHREGCGFLNDSTDMACPMCGRLRPFVFTRYASEGERNEQEAEKLKASATSLLASDHAGVYQFDVASSKFSFDTPTQTLTLTLESEGKTNSIVLDVEESASPLLRTMSVKIMQHATNTKRVPYSNLTAWLMHYCAVLPSRVLKVWDEKNNDYRFCGLVFRHESGERVFRFNPDYKGK